MVLPYPSLSVAGPEPAAGVPPPLPRASHVVPLPVSPPRSFVSQECLWRCLPTRTPPGSLHPERPPPPLLRGRALPPAGWRTRALGRAPTLVSHFGCLRGLPRDLPKPFRWGHGRLRADLERLVALLVAAESALLCGRRYCVS